MHQDLRDALVEDLKNNGIIKTPEVEAAFRTVPRHLFVPHVEPSEAYQNKVIVTKTNEEGGAISSSSQPTIMALMLEQLDLKTGQRVLEIGAGTGYNAALMAHIVGPEGAVYALDIDDDLAEKARQNLASAGVTNVNVFTADGSQGYPAAAPYDRIIMTVSPDDITPAWRGQLAPGGRIVLPLQLTSYQVATALVKEGDWLKSTSAIPCSFMSLRGENGGDDYVAGVTLAPGVFVRSDGRLPLSKDDILALLRGPAHHTPTEYILDGELIFAFMSWLSLQHITLTLNAIDDAANSDLIPPGFARRNQYRLSGGIYENGGLALYSHDPEAPVPEDSNLSKSFQLHILSYGDAQATATFIQQLSEWDSAGRPTVSQMNLKIAPLELPYAPQPGETVLDKQWHKVVVDWNA